MRLSFILALTLFTCFPTLVSAEIQSFRTRGSELRQLIQEIEQHCDRIPQLKEQITKLNSEIHDLATELQQIKNQRDRDLYDLRSGRYCSRCNRTPSQILKKEGETFEEHLKNVSGRSVPAPASRILKEETEYANKIARLQSRYDQSIKKQTKLKNVLQVSQSELRMSEEDFQKIDSNEKVAWAEYQQEAYQSVVTKDSYLTGLDQTIRDLEDALESIREESDTKEKSSDSLNSSANQRNLRRKIDAAKKLKYKTDSELKRLRDSFEQELKAFRQRKRSEEDRYRAAIGSNSKQLSRIAESPFESSRNVASNTTTASERNNMRDALIKRRLESQIDIDDDINFSQLLAESAPDSSIDTTRIPSVEGAFSPKEESKSKSIFDSVRNKLKRAGDRATELIGDTKNEIDNLKQTEAEFRRIAKEKSDAKMLRDSLADPLTVEQENETNLDKIKRRFNNTMKKLEKKIHQNSPDYLKTDTGMEHDKNSVEDSFNDFLEDSKTESESPKENSDEN